MKILAIALWLLTFAAAIFTAVVARRAARDGMEGMAIPFGVGAAVLAVLAIVVTFVHF